MIKKCPVCNSTRFKREMKSFRCKKCGYIWRLKSSNFKPASDI